jgi:hypothetical protein
MFRIERSCRVKNDAPRADDVKVTATHTRPRVSARDLAAAAARLLGTVVLDLADLTARPAVYLPRLAAFAVIVDGDEVISEDDGTLIVLVQPGTADALITEHGTAGAAVAALNRDLRAAGVL